MNVPVEKFPALARLTGMRHAFLCRAPGLEVRTDREEALARLAGYHAAARVELGFPKEPMGTARQVHGNRVAVLREAVTQEAAETDGLVTNLPGLCLGVYVADCCAIYLVDPVKRAIGLLHSGKKGTELGIAGRAVEAMVREYGSVPGDLVAQLSPCIRPPQYEVDFAADIRRQLLAAGVGVVADCGANTAADPERYYSYRMEKGRTGRLLALLMIE
jgi:purine-nucleoside/S-methyl-5'-thioadenosine phosphorylase / adenosine deaminase